MAFWYEELRKGTFGKGIRLLHVDQHSDMKDNAFSLIGENEDEIFDFVNYRCNVGNFIVPALRSGILSEVQQIRSERGLLHTEIPKQDYILDIDLDFWAPEMGIEALEESFKKIRSMIVSAKMVTIATSPYFLDQNLALDLLNKIFDKGKC